MAGTKVVFLDRDGVINQDSPDYIKSPEEFHFIPGSRDAIGDLTAAGFSVMLITNQSVIGRKMASPETLSAIFDKMRRGVSERGGIITDIFFCPHTPADGCRCRKPRAGLIEQARDRHGVELSSAWMVGDSAKDIRCARAAGVGRNILVMTGNGPSALAALEEGGEAPDYVAADLREAVDRILKSHEA